MQISGDKYIVPLSGLTRHLLLSAFSTTRFAMMHEGHPFARLIDEYNLVDPDHLEKIFAQLKQAGNSDSMEFSMDDEILIYTALNITCKTFLTDIADDLIRINAESIRNSTENFSDVRNTLLRGCQLVMEALRSTFNDNDAFMDRVILLDTILNVD